jgi:hypothetical protein
LGEVTTSNPVPPISSRTFRSAIEKDVPTTVCSSVVSVVRRDRISPTGRTS